MRAPSNWRVLLVTGAISVGAIGLVPGQASSATPPHITVPLPACIYEGWQVSMAASPGGILPPYMSQWSQTAGQPQTLSGATTLNASFAVPAKSLTSVANETLTFQFVVIDNLGRGSSPVTTSTTCYLAGDVTHNDWVELGDLKFLVAAWNSMPTSGSWYAAADLDNSGSVNLGDLKILVANWNRGL